MAATETPDHYVGETITAIMKLRGYSDEYVASRIGISRSNLQGKRQAKASRFAVDQLFLIADVLEVEPHVLLMQPGPAVRWVTDHSPPDLGFRLTRRGGAERRWTLPALPTPSLALAS